MYVRVKFNSAKLIISNPKINSDKVSNLVVNDEGKIVGISCDNRENYVDINTPIIFEPVSNMLHVLLGERPVPTFRKSIRKRIEDIDNIARTGYYKIYNPFSYRSNSNVVMPLCEFTQGNKMVFNSHASSAIFTDSADITVRGQVTWSTLKRRYIYNIEKYNQIIDAIEKWCGVDDIVNKMSLLDSLVFIKNSEFSEEAITFFAKTMKIKPFADVIRGVENPETGSVNDWSCKLATRTFNVDMKSKVSLDGEFIFEVSEDEYKKLLQGPRVATFLDNGYAEVICERIDDFDIDFDEYTKL